MHVTEKTDPEAVNLNVLAHLKNIPSLQLILCYYVLAADLTETLN